MLASSLAGASLLWVATLLSGCLVPKDTAVYAPPTSLQGWNKSQCEVLDAGMWAFGCRAAGLGWELETVEKCSPTTFDLRRCEDPTAAPVEAADAAATLQAEVCIDHKKKQCDGVATNFLDCPYSAWARVRPAGSPSDDPGTCAYALMDMPTEEFSFSCVDMKTYKSLGIVGSLLQSSAKTPPPVALGKGPDALKNCSTLSATGFHDARLNTVFFVEGEGAHGNIYKDATGAFYAFWCPLLDAMVIGETAHRDLNDKGECVGLAYGLLENTGGAPQTWRELDNGNWAEGSGALRCGVDQGVRNSVECWTRGSEVWLHSDVGIKEGGFSGTTALAARLAVVPEKSPGVQKAASDEAVQVAGMGRMAPFQMAVAAMLAGALLAGLYMTRSASRRCGGILGAFAVDSGITEHSGTGIYSCLE